jgi:two-component system sensor kinase FixL
VNTEPGTDTFRRIPSRFDTRTGNCPLQILIIEDDADTRANLRDILELDDHVVIVACSMSEALALSCLKQISVVLLDRRLPDGDAEDQIPRLKQIMPTADIVVVTGHADIGSAILALQRGASDYIIKPINPDVLRASLTRTAKQIELRRGKERSEANFRELIEAVGFMVIILNRDHEIVYANRFTTELTGYSAEELVGKSVSAFLEPESQSQVDRQLERLQAGFRPIEQEILLRRRNGDERLILWNVRLLEDFEGTGAVLAVGHDVTERRLLENRALQAERLAAIGQMVTGLAHESRNALQRSQACLDLLTDELQGQTEPLVLVERIQRAQRHLHHLYEEVRSYAAPIVLHREMCDVSRVWQDTWANLDFTRSKKQLFLKEELNVEDLVCSIDPLAVDQVFRNILENAMHVSAMGEQIVIRCDAAKIRGRQALKISISDHGSGLNPEQAARIFEPFYTTKTQGTGLGMAITKRIVESHGGTIRVGGQETRGAVIEIVLPRDIE